MNGDAGYQQRHIPSEIKPFDKNEPVAQEVLSDLHGNLGIDKINQSKNFPNILDTDEIGCQSGVFCIDESDLTYNTEFLFNGPNRVK